MPSAGRRRIGESTDRRCGLVRTRIAPGSADPPMPRPRASGSMQPWLGLPAGAHRDRSPRFDSACGCQGVGANAPRGSGHRDRDILVARAPRCPPESPGWNGPAAWIANCSTIALWRYPGTGVAPGASPREAAHYLAQLPDPGRVPAARQLRDRAVLLSSERGQLARRRPVARHLRRLEQIAGRLLNTVDRGLLGDPRQPRATGGRNGRARLA